MNFILLYFFNFKFIHNFFTIQIHKIYAWTSFNSAGISALGCLLSKCCLYVFGSGSWAFFKQTRWLFLNKKKSVIKKLPCRRHIEIINQLGLISYCRALTFLTIVFLGFLLAIEVFVNLWPFFKLTICS